jgi:hypothetical protein
MFVMGHPTLVMEMDLHRMTVEQLGYFSEISYKVTEDCKR